MKNIHPNVIKFWEDAGYQISSGGIWDKNRNDIRGWHRHIPPINANHKIIARDFEINNKLEIRYFLDPFDGNKYTEEQMLKIIKLKLFL